MKRIYYLLVILFLFCVGNVYSAGNIQVSVGRADASVAVGAKTRVVSINITTDKKIKYVYVFHGDVQINVLSRCAILGKYDKKTGKIASFAEKYEVETSLVLSAPTTECSCEVTKSDTYTIAVETASGQIGMGTIQILDIDSTPPENVTNALCSHYPNGMVYVKWDDPKDSDFEKTELLINGEHVFIYRGTQKYLKANVFDETVKVQARTYDDIGNASEWSSCFEIKDLPFVTDLVMRHSWDIEKGIPMEVSELAQILREQSINKKVTISGGEPLLQKDALLELLEELKDFDLCLYTGHEIEEVPEEILKYLKYIKVGRFILEERTSTTPFVGSKNQKFVRVHHEETK